MVIQSNFKNVFLKSWYCGHLKNAYLPKIFVMILFNKITLRIKFMK